VSFHKSVSV